MKIKITILLSGLLAAAAFSGCTAEGDMPSAQPLTAIRAVNAGLSGVSSRSQVGGIADDGSLVMQWSPGDRIGVFGASQSNVCFTSANETAADETTFSYSGTFSATPSTAYYPYTEGAADAAAVPVNIPAVQTYSDVTSVAVYDFKASSSAERQSDGSYRMRFRSMVTLLRLQIDLSAVSGLAADETLLSIGMTAGTGSLSGAFTCDLNNPDAGLTPVDAAATLTVDMAGRPALSRQVTAYAVAAPGCTVGTKLDFVITTDRHVATFTATLLGTMEGGAFYDVPLNATVLANNSAVIKDVEEPDEPAEETANCYMITTAGEHSFYARQIGNGDKGIIPGAGFHVTSSKINPKSAKVLWQDTQGFIDEGSVRLADDGRVHYTAARNTGNALIAVYSGDGCTGDILWSWHIWGTGDTLPQDNVITTKSGSSFTIMDRNLGAFPSTEDERLQTSRTDEAERKVCSYMLYQWGRKDPIPNSDVYYVDGVATDIASSYPVWQPATLTDATIAASVLRPGYIINKPAVGDCSSWLGEDNRLLWGDSSQKTVTDGGWTDVKTIYDPSPVGYRVANSATFTRFITPDRTDIQMKGVTGFRTIDGVTVPNLTNDYIQCIVSTEMSGTTEYWLPKGIHRNRIGFACNTSDNTSKIFGYGIYFRQTGDDTEGGYYPMGGCRFPNPSGKRSDYALNSYLWLSTSDINDYSAMSMHFYHFYWLTGSGNYTEPDKGLSGTGYNAGVVGTVKTKYSSYNLNAYGVRCVRDGSTSGSTGGNSYDSSYTDKGVGFGVE